MSSAYGLVDVSMWDSIKVIGNISHRWHIQEETTYREDGTKDRVVRIEDHEGILNAETTAEMVMTGTSSTTVDKVETSGASEFSSKPDDTVSKQVTKTTSNIKWIVLTLCAMGICAVVLWRRGWKIR